MSLLYRLTKETGEQYFLNPYQLTQLMQWFVKALVAVRAGAESDPKKQWYTISLIPPRGPWRKSGPVNARLPAFHSELPISTVGIVLLLHRIRLSAHLSVGETRWDA